MNLMPLANLIESAGLATKTIDLFVDMLPSEAENAVLLRNHLSGTKIDHELPGFYRTGFQLIVRCPAREYDAGMAKAEAVVQALWIKTATQVEDHYFHYCRPETEPTAFPLSKGNLIEFSLSFDCCFVKG